MDLYNWPIIPIKRITDKSLENKDLKRKNRGKKIEEEKVVETIRKQIIDRYC